MTRNPANSPDADDSWEQLEADLFGIEVGKEHTANERVASEPAPAEPLPPEHVVPKPIEEDDFGDFGAGLVESAPAPDQTPRRGSFPKVKVKPTPPPEAPPPKPVARELPAFDLSDLDDGPTDEELDDASDEAEDAEVTASSETPEQDPYWDALANWNWQEDDRSGKSRPEGNRDRPRSGGRPAGRSEGSGHGGRGSHGRSGEDRPARGRGSRSSSDDRGSASRRPDRGPAERSQPERNLPDHSQLNESVSIPSSELPDVEHETRPVVEERTPAPADVKSRRQDRRRSRRHAHPAESVSDESSIEQPEAIESADDSWPAAETPRFAPAEPSYPRAVSTDAADQDLDDESLETEDSSDAEGEEERSTRRRRGRRRRGRRPERSDRPASADVGPAADEDIKHLEEDSFAGFDDDELEPQSADDSGSDAGEDVESERPSRGRRPRRRRRGGRSERPERPAPAQASRPRPAFEDDDEDEDHEDHEDEDVEEVLEADADEFDEDHDREFVEEDPPRRSSRRHSRSRRSASETPFVRHIEDEDEEDLEPEPAISYEDVPSWEEAISYLLNPSMVEGSGDSRGGERSSSGSDRGNRGGDRSRPPRRGPRRDA